MGRVLVTGMSGTGKSSVLRALAEDGHRVVDTDEPGWTDEVLDEHGEVVDHVWREPRVAALLAEPGGVVLSGCVSNQGRFYDRLDAVVLLRAPVDVLLARIATRTEHGYGRSPAERARVLADLAEVEPLLRRTATHEVRTDRPLAEVVAQVTEIVCGVC